MERRIATVAEINTIILRCDKFETNDLVRIIHLLHDELDKRDD